MPAYFHCRTCGTQVALVQDYDHSVDDLVNAKFFTEVLNVEVTEDERYHPVTDGMNLAETYCVQCKTLLGWKLIAASQPSRSHRVGGFYMILKELSFWNDETLPNFPFGGDNEQVPNDQDGGTDEEQNTDQDGGTDEEQNIDQDGGANEQNHDPDGGPPMKRRKK
ncbi:protein yippee-like At3g08990 [Solanum verrucosum]|uniref:protein yippee-like At3g08990 n=1 Tax=Solanum verrucosum TaxID=315347 RepID=UPI0020D06217|nr:protein yippee-like At3g08990 [Solanum verrucosum]